MNKFLTLFILFLSYFPVFYSWPLSKHISNAPIIPSTEQFKFMQRFGYLDEGQTGFEAQYSEKSITEAIKNIQRFGGIPQTGVFDANTIYLMKKKRCGVKDIIPNHSRKKRYTIITGGWEKHDLTYFISNWSPKIGEEGVNREIKRALDLWAGYGNLTFTRIYDTSADIVVAFGEGYHGDPFPFDGIGSILAHAFFPYMVYGGNLHFDNDENWTISKTDKPEESTYFFNVAVHEIGHTLGLAHSEVPTSIMYPYYKPGFTSQLDYDDIMGMYQLYIQTEGSRNNENKEYIETTEETEHEQSSTVQSSSEYVTFSETSTHWNSGSSTTAPRETTKSLQDVTFHGDYETVDDHKKHDTKYGVPLEKEILTICDGKYDTIGVLRQELFVFKGKNVWRFKARGKIDDGYPVTIQSIFPNLPIEKIDAAYEKSDGTIRFFSGFEYWNYDGDIVNGPFSLADYELQYNSNGIDAVFIWKKNEKTYLFRGNEFWRFDETTSKLDSDYPKNMTRWRGVPDNIDAAITWTDGSTYFFKGLLYWRFDSTLIKADNHYPLPTSQYWFGCPENLEVIQQISTLHNVIKGNKIFKRHLSTNKI